MISLERKFVFVHIPRCAGTSIESVLAPLCLPLEQRLDKRLPYSAKHDTIRQYREKFNLDEFWKFSFVRHPLTRMISIYRWGLEIVPVAKGVSWQSRSFDEWITTGEWQSGRIESGGYILPPFGRLQSKWVGKAAEVDFIGKFEYLERDWGMVAKHLGLACPLPRLHATSSDIRVDPSAASKKIIYDHFWKDMKRFGYEEL